MNTQALQSLLLNMADDALVIGHRNSEWTGIGPMLEEDLAFSSMAQDKIGHAQALYEILHTHLGMAGADELAFRREEKDFRCCHLVEYPIGEYDFSLVRHFLFDHAEAVRYQALASSSFAPLAHLSAKVKGEIKYHVMHANAFLRQLAAGTEESKARMQSSLNFLWPLAQGIFEPFAGEQELIDAGVYPGEAILKERWLRAVQSVVESAGLSMPSAEADGLGGRKGYHTEFLAPMLLEMTEVVREDPEAIW
jgi:ring-1,2-phenylacetyl-CoA epoxidase subunit PaaC